MSILGDECGCEKPVRCSDWFAGAEELYARDKHDSWAADDAAQDNSAQNYTHGHERSSQRALLVLQRLPSAF